MKKGMAYLFLMLTLSYLLFSILATSFGTNNQMIAYLLAMIVTHFILEKNGWLAELLYKSPDKPKLPEPNREPKKIIVHDHPKVTSITKNQSKKYNEMIHSVHLGEKFNINYNKNKYLIKPTKNGYILTREEDGYTQVFKSVEDLFAKGKIDNQYVKDVINHIN
ncbi:hypothetical protein GCM10008967_20190 [Bacillus carboniphilus]|uniref:Uncharacterized protein n=1 Tax=Bacillus carboniphilus TaxID=86663 RepID=A0ABP3FZP7_9BACI